MFGSGEADSRRQQIRALSIEPDTSLTLIHEDGRWRFSGWSRHTFTELADPGPEDRARRFSTLESASAHFRRLEARDASGTARTRTLHLLGEFRVGDHRFAFYRIGGVHDVVLTRDGNRAAIYRMPTTDKPLASLEHIAKWLLDAHCWEADDDQADERAELRVLSGSDDGGLHAELWRAGAFLGELRVGRRGRYPEPVLAWSLDARPAVAEARGPLHRAALDVVAHYLAGVVPQAPADKPERWQEVCVDLGGQKPWREAALVAGVGLRVMIDVPTMCQQACVFCASPLRSPQERVPGTPDEHLRRLSAFLDDLLPSCERAGTAVEVVLVGDDALSHPRLDDILTLLDCPPVQTVRILTPGVALARDGVAAALARRRNCRGVILTLLGGDAAVHDRVAGRRGAFADLERAVAQCRAAEIEVSLNSILTPHNAAHLGATLDAARDFGLRLCLYLFTTEPMTDPEQARACAMSPAAARAAIEAAGPERLAVVQRINYAPLCYLPPWARSLAAEATNWFPDPPASLPAGCIDCGLRQAGCAGPTRGLVEALGPEVFVGE